MKPLGPQEGGTAEEKIRINVGKPETVDVQDDFFLPEGMTGLAYPVTYTTVTGFGGPSPLEFALVDEAGRSCDYDLLGTVVSRGDQLPTTNLGAGQSASGKLGFAVPRGADLTKYQVLYRGTSFTMAWAGS